jgi:hypothetical protein
MSSFSKRLDFRMKYALQESDVYSYSYGVNIVLLRPVVSKALYYKVAGSRPDEVNEFLQFT